MSSSSSIFKTIDMVTVNSSNKYLNGYIYDVNFQPSIGKEPSRVTISVVSEDGTFATPNLTVQQPSIIQIGNISLTMYPVKYSQKESSQGKTLEVEFIDSSFILDKIYVGLIKKHWNIPKDKLILKKGKLLDFFFAGPNGQVEKNMIILGREIHPCDLDRDGKLDYQEIKNSPDPCDPCQACPQDKYFKMEEKCDSLSYNKVFDVAYTFFELLDGITQIAAKSQVKLTIEKPKLEKEKIDKFLKSYTGTLKQVLDQWCADLALAAIFDPVNNKLFFKDLTKDTKLNETAIKGIVNSEKVKIISQEIEVSMENTCSRGSISLYERNGETKSYPCEKTQSLILPVVTDFDIQGERARQVMAAQGNVPVDWRDDTTSIILSKYSEDIREAFWMRYIYGIIDSTEARKMKQKFELGKGSENRTTGFFEGIDKKIPEMGNLTIIQVIENTGNLTPAALGKLSDEDKLACQQYNYLTSRITDDITRNQFIKNNGYYIIAYHDKELYQKRLDFEKKVFESFGKFYIREGFIKLCGITGDAKFIRQNTDLFAGDGASAEMVGRGYDVNNLSFTKYPYDPNGYLGCLLNPYTFAGLAENDKFKARDKLSEKSPFLTLETKEYEKDEYKAKGIQQPYFGPSIITVDREPKWSPKPDEIDSYKNILQKYQNFALAEYGTDGNGGVAASAYPPELNEILKTNVVATANEGEVNPLPGNIRLYAMIPGKFKYKWEYDKRDHPTERLGAETVTDTKTDKNTIPGLINKKCSVLTIDDTFKIYAPPLALQEKVKPGNLDNNNPCDNYIKDREAAFRILVTQKFNQPKEVIKVQNVQSNLGDAFKDDTFKFELNYLNITDNEFKVLTNSCYPDPKELLKIHNYYNYRQTNSITEKQKKLHYKLKGIPLIDLRKALDLGLEQLNYTYSSDGGVCSISFGNSFAQQLSMDMLRAGFAYNQTQQKSPETPSSIK